MSLSAEARSADALVKDKLTSNCHFFAFSGKWRGSQLSKIQVLVCALGWCPSATARANEELPSRGSRRETADGAFSALAEKAAESHHLYNTKRTNYSL